MNYKYRENLIDWSWNFAGISLEKLKKQKISSMDHCIFIETEQFVFGEKFCILFVAVSWSALMKILLWCSLRTDNRLYFKEELIRRRLEEEFSRPQ